MSQAQGKGAKRVRRIFCLFFVITTCIRLEKRRSIYSVFTSNYAIFNKLVTSLVFLLPLKKAYASSRNVGTLRSF